MERGYARVTGDLFWFPSLALEQFSDQAKREVIHAHIKNIMVMLEEKWGNLQ